MMQWYECLNLIILSITLIYLILNFHETKRKNKVEWAPEVAISIRSDLIHTHFFVLVIENIGGSTAKDIEFTIIDAPKDVEYYHSSKNLMDYHFLREGLPYLAKGQKFQTCFVNAIGNLTDEKLKKKPLSIKVKYKDIHKKEYEEIWNLNFKLFEKTAPPDIYKFANHKFEKELFNFITTVAANNKD